MRSSSLFMVPRGTSTTRCTELAGGAVFEVEITPAVR